MSDEDVRNKFDAFMQRIADSLQKLSNLEVVTICGTVTVAGDPRRPEDLRIEFDPQDAKVLYSRLNLVQGDVTTVIPPDETGDDQPLSKLHFQQVAEASALVEKNVDVMIKLLRAFREWLPEGRRPPDPADRDG